VPRFTSGAARHVIKVAEQRGILAINMWRHAFASLVVHYRRVAHQHSERIYKKKRAKKE
jgi:hypothetical protein